MAKKKRVAAKEKSPTLALLEESGAAPTRDNFLNLASLGNPSSLDAEEEAELPAPLQETIRDNDRKLFDSAQKKNFIAMKSPYAKQ